MSSSPNTETNLANSCDPDNPLNNINTEFIWVFFVYLLTAIFLIGAILNIIFLTKKGEAFKIKFLKKFKFIYVISLILVWGAVLYFPISSIYFFSQFYYNKKKNMF